MKNVIFCIFLVCGLLIGCGPSEEEGEAPSTNEANETAAEGAESTGVEAGAEARTELTAEGEERSETQGAAAESEAKTAAEGDRTRTGGGLVSTNEGERTRTGRGFVSTNEGERTRTGGGFVSTNEGDRRPPLTDGEREQERTVPDNMFTILHATDDSESVHLSRFGENGLEGFYMQPGECILLADYDFGVLTIQFGAGYWESLMQGGLTNISIVACSPHREVCQPNNYLIKNQGWISDDYVLKPQKSRYKNLNDCVSIDDKFNKTS